jgi:hypothetical protein
VRKRKEGGLGQKTNTKNCPEIALQGERRSLARLCIPVRRLRYAVGGRKNSRHFGYVKRIASLKSVCAEIVFPAVFGAFALGNGPITI